MFKYIILLILVIVVIWLLISNIRIVPQAKAYVVERLGAYRATWQVGLHFKIPLIDKVAGKVSLKEKVIDFPPQAVITKDNVTMEIDTVVYFQITDPKLYTYGVERIAGESMSDAIRRTPTYQKNSVPQARYVEEDVATGLIPLTYFAKRLGIETSTADKILALCDQLYPNRDRSNDRTLMEFSDEYLKDYLLGKYFTITD